MRIALTATEQKKALQLKKYGTRSLNRALTSLKGSMTELINANRIVFRLGYHDNKEYNNKQQWHKLLGSPTWGNDFFEKPVSVTVGLANTVNSNELITVNNDKKFSLQKICSVEVLDWSPYLFIHRSGKFISWLRARASFVNGNKDTSGSLARCQMAFWFILIIYSFPFSFGE